MTRQDELDRMVIGNCQGLRSCWRRISMRRSTAASSRCRTTARIRTSEALDGHARVLLDLERPLQVRGLADGHRAYLPWYRERVFLK